MPFITPEERKIVHETGMCNSPGNKCYWCYSDMVNRWRLEPRWATADAIFESVKKQDPAADWQRAKELAWQVFFNLHVMEYERQKRDINGDI